ncbi:MAG: low temperature requirement protein A [Mycoplasmatales bacterium]
MKDYFKHLKRSFAPLHLNNEDNLDNARASHPLELFFDLVFVVALGKVSHVFLQPDVKNIIMAIILFLAIYQIWKNITKFNAYFFQHSLINSFLFVIIMIPIFFITSMVNYNNLNNIYLLIVLFTFSRLILSFTWYKLVYKNKLITNTYINKVAKYYSGLYISSSLILLVSFINYQLFYLILITSVLVEIMGTYFVHYKLKKFTRPQIDIDLLQERRVLFVILIWGEALVTAGSVFPKYSSFTQAITMNLALFLIISFFFLRAVASFGDAYNIKRMKFWLIEFTDYTFPLQSLSLFVSIAGIASTQQINELSRWIVIIDLAYINLTHYLGNLKATKQEYINANLAKFIKLDNLCLLLQGLITVILIFVTGPQIFVYLILLIFILHFLAVPIRHRQTEYF